MENVKIQEKAEADWVIARDGGVWLVGRPEPGPDGAMRWLAPVFELACQVTQTPQGTMVNYGAQPIMLIPTLDRWQLSPYANIWPVKGQSVEKQLRGAIVNAQDTAAKLRIAHLGLVPPTMTDARHGPVENQCRGAIPHARGRR